MHEMLLLGAGASKEAEVPATYEMTKRILGDFRNDPFLQDEAHVLSFVAGGLMLQQGIRNENPFSGVDVEELFNAVQLLAERHTLEAAPFVGSWHNMVEEFDKASAPRSQSKDLYRHIQRSITGALEDAVPTKTSMDVRGLLETLEALGHVQAVEGGFAG